MRSPPYKAFEWTLLIAAVLILIVIRAMLPFLLKRKVNEKLATLPDYTAHVDGVSLALWRGAFTLKDLEFKHRAGDMALTIPAFEIRLAWLPLLRRTVVVDLYVESPRLRVLAKKPIEAAKKTTEKTRAAKQAVEQKTGKSLPDLLVSLIPFKVNRFHLSHGTLRFREEGQDINQEAEKDKEKPKNSKHDEEKEAGLEARVTDIDIVLANITNTRKESKTLTATGSVDAKIMNQSRFHLDLAINPVAKEPEFNLKMNLEELELTGLNAVLDWQWGIRVDQGTFTLFSENAASGGGFKGYIKPLIKDLHIAHKPKSGTLQTVKETIVKVVAKVLKNKDTQMIGTEAPLEGRFENPQVGIWEAIIEVLRNAFIRALRPSFDPTFKP